MGTQLFYSKGPHLLPWGGSHATHRKITISAHLATEIGLFLQYTCCTNVAIGQELETHKPKPRLSNTFG